MIEPMKKVTVVCLEQARQRAVDELGELGIVHVMPVTPPASDQLDKLLRKQADLARAQTVLAAHDHHHEHGTPPASAE